MMMCQGYAGLGRQRRAWAAQTRRGRRGQGAGCQTTLRSGAREREQRSCRSGSYRKQAAGAVEEQQNSSGNFCLGETKFAG